MESTLFRYKAELVRVLDGDTVDLIVDLGFNIKHQIRVRFLDFNAPETRTRDLEEKARGLAAKSYLEELLFRHVVDDVPLFVKTAKTGKYGRWLGVLFLDHLNLNLEVEKFVNNLE